MYSLEPKMKLDLILNNAWKIFISQFVNGRIKVAKEAPFQHYFANIIKQLGDLYCFSRNEQFLVDLEEKESNILGKNKYIDITCSITLNGEQLAKAAIELKFKKKSQGADDEGRIDAYIDIQSLEHCLDRNYDLAYFFMITDWETYTKSSKKLDSTAHQFSIKHDYSTPRGIELLPKLASRAKIKVNLRGHHKFKWETHGGNYFLIVPVHNGVE